MAQTVIINRWTMQYKEIKLKNKVHTISSEVYGSDDLYLISIDIDMSFREAKSHAAEVDLLCTYSPDSEYGSEGDEPYIALIEDDVLYYAGKEYKEKGEVNGAEKLVPLTGIFSFIAKMAYYDEIMYFYSFDRCGGDSENVGLCAVAPRE